MVNHSDMETVKKASQWIVNVLLQSDYGQILGPVFPYSKSQKPLQDADFSKNFGKSVSIG